MCPLKCWHDYLIKATNLKYWHDYLIKATNYPIRAREKKEARVLTIFVDLGPLFHYFRQNGDIFSRSEHTRPHHHFNFGQTYVFKHKVRL